MGGAPIVYKTPIKSNAAAPLRTFVYYSRCAQTFFARLACAITVDSSLVFSVLVCANGTCDCVQMFENFMERSKVDAPLDYSIGGILKHTDTVGN